MNNDDKAFEEMLKKYKLKMPIPPEVRSRISRDKKEVYIAILKKAGRYNIIIGILVSIFFFLNKIGIPVSLVQSTIIVITITTLSVAGVSTGTYMAVKRFMDRTPQIEMQKDVPAKPIQPDTLKNEATKQSPTEETTPVIKDVKNIIYLQPFEGQDCQGTNQTLVADVIQRELMRIRGTTNIKPWNASNQTNRLVLLGTVRKHEALYTITIKIIENDTSRIRFATTEEASAATLVPTSKKIAKEISNNIE